MDYTFGVLSKMLSPYSRSSRFSLILYSRSFIVLQFTLKYVIYFELIFVKSVRSLSIFFSFFLACGCPSTICWKDCLCSIVLLLLLCQRSLGYIYVGLFLNSLFCSIDLFVYSFTNSTLSCSLQLYSNYWSWIASVL